MKPNTGNPLSGYKTLGLDPVICFYEVEDKNKIEEEEDAEILVTHYSILVASKKNLVKMKFSWIGMFYHEIPAMINEMRVF